MNETESPASGRAPSDGRPSPSVLGPGRAAGIFAAFLAVQFVVVSAAAVIVYLRWGEGAHGPGGSPPDAPGFIIVAALVGTALAGAVVLGMARRTLPGPLRGGALASLGWAPATPQACARAALEGLGIVALLALLSRFAPAPAPGLGPLGRIADLGWAARIAGLLLVAACAPPVEELMFRGVLYAGLASRWRPATAAAVTTTAFAALHVLQAGKYWPGLIAVGLVGALALRARVATGSLLPAIVLHATYNLGQVLAAAAAR